MCFKQTQKIEHSILIIYIVPCTAVSVLQITYFHVYRSYFFRSSNPFTVFYSYTFPVGARPLGKGNYIKKTGKCCSELLFLMQYLNSGVFKEVLLRVFIKYVTGNSTRRGKTFP